MSFSGSLGSKWVLGRPGVGWALGLADVKSGRFLPSRVAGSPRLPGCQAAALEPPQPRFLPHAMQVQLTTSRFQTFFFPNNAPPTTTMMIISGPTSAAFHGGASANRFWHIARAHHIRIRPSSSQGVKLVCSGIGDQNGLWSHGRAAPMRHSLLVRQPVRGRAADAARSRG